MVRWVGSIAVGLLFVCTLETTVFAVLYGLRSQWRATSIGRATFYTFAGMAAVLWLAVSRLVFHWPTGVRVWLGLAVYGTLAILFGWKLRVLIQIQRDPEKVEIRDAERFLARRREEGRSR